MRTLFRLANISATSPGTSIRFCRARRRAWRCSRRRIAGGPKPNWKIGALNFVGDSQHILTTHVGPLTLDPIRAARAGFATAAENSFQVVTDQGHGCTLTYLAPGLPGRRVSDTPRRSRAALQQDPASASSANCLNRLRVIVGTIFPNLSFIETQVGPAQKAIIIRQWKPVSGTEMEILSWVLAEKEASCRVQGDGAAQRLS